MYSVPSACNPGLVYQTLWSTYLSSMQGMRETLGKLSSLEISDLRIGESTYGCFESCDYTYESRLMKKAERIVTVMERIAAVRFAPAGARELEIKKNYKEKFVKKHKIESFDPLEVWNALEKDLGGTSGRDLGYQQAAEKLVRHFGIKQGMQLKQVRDRVILEMSIWTERHYDQRVTLNLHGCEARVAESMLALKTVATWAGLDTSGAFDALVRQWSYNGSGISSRERLAVSEDIDVITYLGRFEFRFTQAYAGKLQEFVSLYGSDYMKDRL
jgi:hypothetical protein